MNNDSQQTAFIAMRFGDDHWRDKVYVIIREELEKAGYVVIRGDEIKTSGPVVDEVCRLLRESDLVVIDTSGDSHNVTYELGFCHGIGRDPGKTLLLRQDHNLHFNYQHFRHRVYKDTRHLRRLIRDYINIYEPIYDDMYGYAFTFEFSAEATFGYIMDGAEIIMDSILNTKLSGRLEIYSAEQFTIPGRFFTVAVAMRLRGKQNTPTYQYWSNIVKKVAGRDSKLIKLATDMSEFSEVRAMKEWLVFCGAAEITEGKVTRMLESSEDANFILSYLKRKNPPKNATTL